MGKRTTNLFMKSRLIITVGTLLFGASLTKAGMTWEEWTPENGIVDGQAALQEMLEAGKMPDENWQEKAQTFINAFEKLKLQLQFFWRSQVGEGGIIENPWNGIPDGFGPYHKKGYVKRDCPIVLHFWANDHIGKYVEKPSAGVVNLYEPNKSHFLPSSFMCSESNFQKIKGKFRKHIYGIFRQKSLKLCALFLNQNFCTPVSKLISYAVMNLKEQNSLQKQDLEILLQCPTEINE